MNTTDMMDDGRIDIFLDDLANTDPSFALSEPSVEKLLENRGARADEDAMRADICIRCDAPKDVCNTCDTIDCIICDAPNDVECPSPPNDKCQWCTLRDPGAPSDAG